MTRKRGSIPQRFQVSKLKSDLIAANNALKQRDELLDLFCAVQRWEMKINWNAIEALSKEETCTGLNVPDCNVCIAIKGAREMLKLRGSAEDKREREQGN